jgi:hypothetical protein
MLSSSIAAFFQWAVIKMLNACGGLLSKIGNPKISQGEIGRQGVFRVATSCT